MDPAADALQRCSPTPAKAAILRNFVSVLRKSPARLLPIPPAPVTPSDKTLAILCHVAPFLGVPFLLPFIVYLVKRDESPYVAAHAKEAFNFHFSMLLYVICTIPFIFITCGLFIYLAYPLYIAIAGVTFVCAIIASIKASEGGFFAYPLTLRLF